MENYATQVRRQIELASEVGKKRNAASQKSKANDRLAAALEFGPARVLHRTKLGELAWHNCISGQRTFLELYHELSDGDGKFSVYVDGVRWRNGWSITKFCGWLGGKIDRVKDEWK